MLCNIYTKDPWSLTFCTQGEYDNFFYSSLEPSESCTQGPVTPDPLFVEVKLSDSYIDFTC